MADQAAVRINKSTVTKLQEGQILRDNELKGFGVRRRKGAPSYFLQTRINGRLRWFTIGKHGAPWTPITARAEALRLLNDINNGEDPGQRKSRLRRAPTLSEASELFLKEHGAKLKPSTEHDYRALLRHHIVPALGALPIADLSQKHIARFHIGMKHIPRQANYALAVLSKLMNWAEDQGLRPSYSNPCLRIKRFPETRRQRFLSSEELERLGRVLAEHEQDNAQSPFIVAAIRLLMFTGARLGEILPLQWQYVDLERGLLLLPDSKTGQKAIFLNEPAVDLLKSLPRYPGNPHVIVGAKQDGHLVNLQKPWGRIRRAASLEDVRLHDLRHSFASIAASSGGSLPLIGQLLGHTQMATTQRYAHLAAAPVKELNEKVGARLAQVLGSGKTKDD